MLREASYYSGMALAVHRFLRAPVAANPEEFIRAQMENREAAFLETARKVIFANPANPFAQMFKLAGCAQDDLADSVKRDGLEATLKVLHRNGVWLAHDELKGAKPIVRSGRQIPSNQYSFRNPLISGLFEATSGGSRSPGMRTRRSLDQMLHREAQESFRRREFSLPARSLVEVRPILPSTTGLHPCLRAARDRHPVERWFVPGGNGRNSGHYKIVTGSLVMLANAMGAKVPPPRQLPQNDFSPAAEWLAQRKKQGISCAVGASVSAGVRVVQAAIEKGLDIRGTLFLVNGEPLSEAKGDLFRQAGCHGNSQYGLTEIGAVGCGCREMANRSCTHLFRDSVAAINYRRRAPLTEVEVDSILLTSLTTFAPNVLINFEMHDCGVIEKAPCDCVYSRAGFTEQIRDIYSFGKLTGFGVTLVGTDLVRVLEQVLPQRLGGAPGDYQLVEREGGAQTQLVLRISPRVNLASKESAKECFLGEIERLFGGSLAARTWKHAEAIEVVVGEPLTTSGGKVLLLHLLHETAGLNKVSTLNNAHSS